MFKKKICPRCGKKTSDSNSFCPECGYNLNKNKDSDWGMLGKKDIEESFDPFSNSIFGGMTGGILGKMVNNMMKMMEKEMREIQKEQRNPNSNSKTHIELFVNGKKIDPKNIKITKMPGTNNSQTNQINEQENVQRIFSKDKTDQFKKLKKVEPKTNLRRLSDRLIYEIEMPGVKKIDDISLLKLENSIEVKGISKDTSYLKSIPVKYPIIEYSLEKEKLTLEFNTSEN